MAATSATSERSEGAVVSVINKRVRALKKKLTRIEQMESSISQGKSLNPEQLSVVNSKPSILSRIDELTSLLPSLTQALDEQLSSLSPNPNPIPIPNAPPQDDNNNNDDANNDNVNDNVDMIIRGLVELMYFGRLFDVTHHHHQQSDFRAHLERECCLTYDYVTDDDVDATGLLSDGDFNLISALQGFIVSKPPDSIVSHKDAVDLSTHRAKLWIQNAHLPVDEASNVTYAALREKLNKIISSDYVTATPHMKGPGEVAAAAAVGNFGLFEVPETMVNVEVPIQVEGSPEQDQQQTEEHAEHATNYEEHETTGHLSGNIEEEFHKDEPENPPEVIAVQTDQEQSQNAEGDQGFRNADFNDQQYVQRRGQRGGRGGGRRGYSNGRGGRGNGRGNGPYQNGRNQYNDNYYPRNNYYNRRGGRGGGGNGGGYYNNSSGAQGNYSEANVGVAS